MEISERKIGSVTVLKLSGSLTMNAHPEHLSQFVSTQLQARARLFVLNLADCQRIDSTGLGEVIRSYKSILDANGEMKLAGVSLQVRSLIAAANLASIIETHESEQKAINSFGY